MSIQVVYFPGKGRAEKIRLLLADVGADWENVFVDYQAFSELKSGGELQWGSLPMVRVDGKSLSQSDAILSYLARKFDKYPANAEDAHRADSLIAGIADFMGKVYPKHPRFGGSKEALKEFADTESSRWIGAMQKVLEDAGTPYVLGDDATLPDYALADLLISGEETMPGLLDKYPTLRAYVERFKARPNIAAYYSSDKSLPPNEPAL